MPSPAGHVLAGLAAGWLVHGVRRPWLAEPWGWRQAALFGALGMAADLDLVAGIHSGPTHGLGVALLAASAAWLPGVAPGSPRLSLALACVLAYASHTVLDWLGTDTSAPIGIMALWPLTNEYYESGLHVFMAVSRRIHQPELFWTQNLQALARELLILIPIVITVALLRARFTPHDR